ncbi:MULTISPECIES: methyltransferase family protein [Enterococcus]|uniref:methyltransferase family protein n=1 Tax=Enterococcus TaxID=1350 RepID=UPI000ED84B57|nr:MULTISPECIES: isoprenylcysteine carboxylmethyltransferase family protein [Enterococcus]HCM87654.1 isoprenylcysteine carboxyl methyltransferase [Enterococcus sp.]
MKARHLLKTALFKFVIGFIMLGILLFFPAGSFTFWNAWLFISLLFLPMIALGIILWLKAPDLLEKRLNTKERETEQKEVIAGSLIMFILGFVLAGLDFRFKWSLVPDWLVIIASIVFLTGYLLYAEVMRENAYLSRTVEVQEDQTVIDTGLYGLVRHPMYFATLLMFLSIPFTLGSLFAVPIFLIYPFLIIKRIMNEEAILAEELAGYKEYQKKVNYRLLPYIW